VFTHAQCPCCTACRSQSSNCTQCACRASAVTTTAAQDATGVLVPLDGRPYLPPPPLEAACLDPDHLTCSSQQENKSLERAAVAAAEPLYAVMVRPPRLQLPWGGRLCVRTYACLHASMRCWHVRVCVSVEICLRGSVHVNVAHIDVTLMLSGTPAAPRSPPAPLTLPH
jgi:hypothetical protein